MKIRGRPLTTWLLVAVLGQLSVRATVGGVALVVAPDGAIGGLSTAPLQGTPMADFLVPGLVLFVVFGVGSAVACYALLTRHGWAWVGSLAIGVALVVWIAVEVVVGFDRPTVLLNLATSAVILALAIHPSVRRGRTDGTRVSTESEP